MSVYIVECVCKDRPDRNKICRNVDQVISFVEGCLHDHYKLDGVFIYELDQLPLSKNFRQLL